jgi:hypothetical protein
MMDKSLWRNHRFVFHKPYDGQICQRNHRFVFQKPYGTNLAALNKVLSFINAISNKVYENSLKKERRIEKGCPKMLLGQPLLEITGYIFW